MIPTMNEFLKSILDGINSFIGNYGWSVVIFTLLIKLVLMPFDYKSRVSMRKTQALQPKLNELQKRYANDKEKLNKKMAELYQKEKISPMSSCLPMLLTMPVLFAMFAAMRLVAGENMVAQTFAILQGSEPVMESWLWVKNIWMPDSPFAAAWPDLANLQMVEAHIWQSAFSALEGGVASLPEALQHLTLESFSNNNLRATIEEICGVMNTIPSYVEATKNLPGWPTLDFWIAKVDVKNVFNGFFILPILSAATQFLMTIGQPQPQAQEGQPNSGAFMKWFFPIFSLWICSSYNAVFAIYWVASNIIAGAQNLIINWILDSKEKNAKTAEGTVK